MNTSKVSHPATVSFSGWEGDVTEEVRRPAGNNYIKALPGKGTDAIVPPFISRDQREELETSHSYTDTVKLCPRCQKEFECRPFDISSCNCSKIELSKEEYRFISSKYTRCVCNACLTDLKNEYNMNYQYNYNNPDNSRNRTFCVFFLAFFLSGLLNAQSYAPPVGQAGTSAMYADSAAFVNWATGCVVTRGYQDISNPSGGFASVGDGSMATGKALTNAVVSLGDGGSAICTFEKPISNGPGFDFAIFENGFDDQFLELAFVEVSSDGVNFFRFHAHSLTDTTTQTASFGPTDATKINNLAGKYRGGYGTPFDLQELNGIQGLNVNQVTHIKIIDVVGSIDPHYATRDYYHNKINDPWPTAYASGGFDLDAVGVIHESGVTGISEYQNDPGLVVYPNPINAGQKLRIRLSDKFSDLELMDMSGRSVLKTSEPNIDTSALPEGIYYLVIHLTEYSCTRKVVILGGTK